MVFVAALVGCDHATKIAAEAALSVRGARTLAPGLLELRLAHNDDTAFSTLHALHLTRSAPLLTIVAAIALVAVASAWWTRRRLLSKLEHVGFAAVLAGALGNVSDRLARGYVVDFIHVTRWPVFNVADIAVTLGIAAILVGAAWRKRAALRAGAPAT